MKKIGMIALSTLMVCQNVVFNVSAMEDTSLTNFDAQTACQADGGIWNSDLNTCTTGNVEDEVVDPTQTQDNLQNACAVSGGIWDPNSSTCITENMEDEEIHDTQTQDDPQNACEVSGGIWDPNLESCTQDDRSAKENLDDPQELPLMTLNNGTLEFEITDEASFQNVIAYIKEQKVQSGLSAATLVFNNNFTFTYEKHQDQGWESGEDYDDRYVGENYFSGIAGVEITLTSKDPTQPVTLNKLGATFGNTRLNNAGFSKNDGANARLFTGPMILDNIILNTRENDYYFAQGNKLIFTENFQNTNEISVVGGNLGTKQRLDGLYFEQGNGTGLNAQGTTAGYTENPRGVASTHIEIYNGDFQYIYGGGYNSDVQGDTYVKVALDPNNTITANRYNVDNLFGGGVFAPSYNSTPSDGTSSTVGGNTYVEAVSGTFGTIFGGANNYSGRRGGKVNGNTNVVIGQETGQYLARFSNAYGGSNHGTIGARQGWDWVGGNTTITLNPTADGILDDYNEPIAHVYGGGDWDTINGTTKVILNGGNNVDWVFAGGSNSNYDQKASILNQNQAEYAAQILINGGAWNEIYSNVCTFSGSLDANSEQLIDGNIFVQFNDGFVNRFVLSAYMTHTTGDSRLDINGGQLGNTLSAISGYRYTNHAGNALKVGQVDGKRIVNIQNNVLMKCWQIHAIDEIHVNNTAPFIARGATSSGALQNCGNLNVNQGLLALTGTNNLVNMSAITGKQDIHGDVTIGTNGYIALNGTNDIISTPGVMNANGSASGAGNLLVIQPTGADTADDWISTDLSTHPAKVGEVYMRSHTTNETAQPNTRASVLTLQEQNPQLYVEYTQDQNAIDTYAHAWRIAKDDSIQSLTVTFDKNGGDTEANPTQKIVILQNGQQSGTVDRLPTPPTKEGYEFMGWNTAADGSGDAFDEHTPVSSNLTVYAQWQKKDSGEIVPPTETYTVTYTDGVDDEVIFEDQITNDLASGTPTPAFNGTPTRDGYDFIGWDPEVAQTVTETITYTAKWQKKDTGEVTPPTETYTVTYTDGVDGEVIFEDQVTTNLASGDKTPAFIGAISRDGYDFIGWDPAISPTVTKTITYTAQWKKQDTGGSITPTEKYTVTYTDGVDDEVIFEDQITTNLRYNQDTPDFVGTPSRQGYRFLGWAPKVSEKVTKSVTYVAQWEKLSSNPKPEGNVPPTTDGNSNKPNTQPGQKPTDPQDQKPTNNGNKNPDTGISSHLALNYSLMTMSAGVLLYVIFKRKQ